MTGRGGEARARLKVISHNVKGLLSPNKRRGATRYYRKLRADVVLLQETHFTRARVPGYWGEGYTAHYHSAGSTRKTGVSILMRGSLHFHLTQQESAMDGRYLRVSGTIEGKPVTFVSVYAPSPPEASFWRALEDRFAQLPNNGVFVGGDFNAVMDSYLDRSGTALNRAPPRSSKIFRGVVQAANLYDSWRLLHPRDRDYSFYSNPHDSYSRLDHIFCSRDNIPALVSSTIHEISWSDHAAVEIALLGWGTSGSASVWRFNASLLLDPGLKDTMNLDLTDFFERNFTPDMAVTTVWEAHKAFMRGKLIAIASRRKRERAAETVALTTRVGDLEREHKRTGDATLLRELLEARGSLNMLLSRQVQAALQWTGRKFFEKSNKPDTLLARRLKQQTRERTVRAVRLSSGEMTSDPRDISGAFCSYYASLYNGTTATTGLAGEELIREFLSRTDLPSFSHPQRAEMAAPISTEEVAEVIKHLHSSKSPGPDGFSVPYYKGLSPALLQPLTRLFNTYMKGREVPSSDMLLARIVVIPKPGKDPAVCPSYRPISLINVDMKIYAKILANRIGHYIAEVVHPDQVGFIPGREAPDNIRRALNLIQEAKTSGRSTLLLSLDAEKAFDRVDWKYLWATLTTFGIRGDLLTAIQALYAGPRAQVDTGGFLSAPFSILNGTRQGCPLSPLLFALSIEPLAAYIRNHPDVRGVEVGGKPYKMSLFADDVLLSLTSPITTLPNLMRALRDYGRISGYKLNADKSEVLDLNLTEEERAVVRDRFPFRWCRSSMGSLGTQLTPTWEQLYSANYGVLLPSLHTLLSTWSHLNLSLFGRIYAVKMTLLPKLLYLFRTLTIPIRRADLTFLQSAIHSFIWGGRRGRLPKNLMFQSRRQGGMGVPHLYTYYKAAQFAMLSMINLRSGAPLWTTLEQDMGGPQLLRTLQWAPKATPRTLHNSPTLQHSLRLWNLYRDGDGLSPPGSGLQSLFYNPRFPEGNPPGRSSGGSDPTSRSCAI
uniref:Reverse transcriptase domain-containing protein n=1 Tax=Leptobrachium leishanense TaxID=445787 RepID=A0A8C5QIU9_9ANUR